MVTPLPDLALGIILHPQDAALLPDWLAAHAPHADAVLAVLDADGATRPAEEILRDHFAAQPDRLHILLRPLRKDFAAQRNACAAMNPCRWLLMLDADERIDAKTMHLLRPALAHLLASRPDLRVLGFPRRNTLDGLPTEVWPDHQFRLVRRDVRWQNTHPHPGASPGCHEFPLELHTAPETVAVLDAVVIRHDKSAERQAAQNAFYDDIDREETSKGDR